MRRASGRLANASGAGSRRTGARLPPAVALGLAVALSAGCAPQARVVALRDATASRRPAPSSSLGTVLPAPIAAATATTTVPAVQAGRVVLPLVPVRRGGRRFGGPPRVVLYGDSLAWESQDAFRFALRGVDVLTRVYPGTAICGWFPDMRSDAATFHPDLVIAEFVGVDFSPCIADRAPPTDPWPTVVATFQADARTADTIFTNSGAAVIWIGVPPTRFSADRSVPDAFAALANGAAGVGYSDAGQSVAPSDVFTWTMPCLPAEPACRAGQVLVRSPDGFHFCPVESDWVCPVWSGGAYRFGVAMAEAATEALAARGLIPPLTST